LMFLVVKNKRKTRHSNTRTNDWMYYVYTNLYT
jgi:hypothetical protein